MRGTVKFFCTKGWGFITDGNGKDWYFHHSNVIMDGYKHLFTDDIVDFEVGIGKNGREQALNVTPILTIKMVEDALKKDNLYLQILQISKDDRCVCLYRVVDSNDILQTDENGMTLVEVAAYAGIDVEGIMDKLDNPVIKECAGQFTEAFHTKVLADVVTNAVEKVIQIDA